MFSHTSKTVRARGIAGDEPRETVQSYAEALCRTTQHPQKLIGMCIPWRLPTNSPLIVSLAPQAEWQVASITFPSRSEKSRTLGKYKPGSWDLDDDFNGLTVLHEGEKPLIDICAVHGLNGNAFETWAWDGTCMWLRDFVPSNISLGQSRTMTFGYSSRLSDGANTSGLAEWASGLLREVSAVRNSSKERTRPIIFVVHSLGGLVAREAMIELNRHLNLYPGLDLRYCGLLFLATPHSGVVLADWNPYLVQFSELMGIRGRELTQILQAFNKGSHVSKQDFKRLPYPVPYECLHETIKTKVGLRKKLIVPADAAGLNDVFAQAMSDVDHRNICRFPSQTHRGYAQIIDCLIRITHRVNSASTSLTQADPVPLSPQHTETGFSQALTLASPEPEDEEGPGKASGEPRQTSAEHDGIRSGTGTGGNIIFDEQTVKVSGGHGTGASMRLSDMQKLRGRFEVEGGRGMGATIS